MDGLIKFVKGLNVLQVEKCDITNNINHNFGKIRVDSYNYLPVERMLTFHDVIILIKSVANNDKNNYHYNIFLEKGLYKDKSNTECF